nr:hypothetical protein [Tanacetum cinerariifolium]
MGEGVSEMEVIEYGRVQEETNSGSTTTHVDYSFPKYDSFLFEIEPDQDKLTSVVMKDNLAKPQVHVPNVLTTHPTLMLDSDFIPSNSSLPEYKIFYFDIEEKNSGSTTIHADISLSDIECFKFDFKPDPGELTIIVDSGVCKNIPSATNVNSPPEEDHSTLFSYVVWIFLSFLTYPVVPPNLLSFRNEDTIFELGISNYHFPSLLPNIFCLPLAPPWSNEFGDWVKLSDLKQALRRSVVGVGKTVNSSGVLFTGEKNILDKMSRDVITVGSTMRIPLLYPGEYSQWRERLMNYLEEQKDESCCAYSDPLALVAEKTNVSKRKEKVVVSSDSEGSGLDDFSELKKITTLLAKAFNQRKFYSKPTNNNLKTSSTSQSANRKQEFVKSDDKKEDKKADEKKRDMSKVKCYNCKKEGHFGKDCKKAKVKDYNYHMTKMLLAKKDSDEQVLLAEDQAWMESSSDSD